MDPPVEKKKRGNKKGWGEFQLGPALQEFTGLQQCARSQVVKKIWDYVKTNGLQDQGDKRFIILDDKLKSIFGKDKDKIHMFTMNKELGQHFGERLDADGNDAPKPVAIPKMKPTTGEPVYDKRPPKYGFRKLKEENLHVGLQCLYRWPGEMDVSPCQIMQINRETSECSIILAKLTKNSSGTSMIMKVGFDNMWEYINRPLSKPQAKNLVASVESCALRGYPQAVTPMTEDRLEVGVDCIFTNKKGCQWLCRVLSVDPGANTCSVVAARTGETAKQMTVPMERLGFRDIRKQEEQLRDSIHRLITKLQLKKEHQDSAKEEPLDMDLLEPPHKKSKT